VPGPLVVSLVLAYASALRAFDPALGAADAGRLAARVIAEADAARIDARLVVALVAVESSWDPRAVSPAGARGLGQLMPGTAAGLGVDPDDPGANLHGTVRHLGALLARYRSVPVPERYARAIAAYNAGAGAVDRFGGIPPYAETRSEVRRVIALWRRLCGV
jgi:soluble lytic murein transglycosylase-like protein